MLSVNGETSLSLRFPTFFYPGWEARIDGRRCDIMIDKDSGAIIIEVPEGKHKIGSFSFQGGNPMSWFDKPSA